VECPTCKGIVVSPEGQNGERVCSVCGIVLARQTIMGQQNFTYWNPRWSSNWQENDPETLKEWLTFLRTVSCQLNIPSFPYREEAARRIRKENRRLFQSQKFGKHKRATVAALLHQVLKQYDKNRSVKEICQQLSLDSRLVSKQIWNLNKLTDKQDPPKTLRRNSTNYLYDYGGKLTSDITLLEDAKKVLTKMERTGGNPIALASGALYLVCKSRNITMSKEQIAEAFKISPRTVYTNEARIRTLLQHRYIQKQEAPNQGAAALIMKVNRKR
jgi:transcription initiation factor TFIIIB Brf1 subunit/transcription initiation factor TFIIB